MPYVLPKIERVSVTQHRLPAVLRYAAIGNSWAVSVFRWVGKRINAFEELTV